jgi:hypothetical protein
MFNFILSFKKNDVIKVKVVNDSIIATGCLIPNFFRGKTKKNTNISIKYNGTFKINLILKR